MPKNHSQIKAKQIKGKKIREQYLDGLLWGLPFGAIVILLLSLYDIQNFVEKIKDVFILILCFLPVLIFVLLNKICIGKIICILTDDKIYYFNAFTKIKKQNNRTNGYVYYSEIDDIIYVPSNLGIHGSPSQVEIYGQDFKITIVNANKSLIKKINIRMKGIEENCHEPNTI